VSTARGERGRQGVGERGPAANNGVGQVRGQREMDGRRRREGLLGGVHIAFHVGTARWHATYAKVANTEEITSLQWQIIKRKP
jgi:hypothetical protein